MLDAFLAKAAGLEQTAYSYALENCTSKTIGYMKITIQVCAHRFITESGPLESLGLTQSDLDAIINASDTGLIPAIYTVLAKMRVAAQTSEKYLELRRALLDAPSAAAILEAPESGNSLLARAISFEIVKEALDILIAKGGKITREALLNEEYDMGASNLALIAQSGHLAELFAPALWVGNAREMRECWRTLDDTHKGQLDGKDDRPDFIQMMHEVNALASKSHRSKGRS